VSFSQGIGGVQTGFLGLGVPLGTNRLVIVRCGLLDRETVELITKHPDTGFISIETILYTLPTLQKHCCSYQLLYVFLQFLIYILSVLKPEPKCITSTCLCSVDKHPRSLTTRALTPTLSVPRPSRPLTNSLLTFSAKPWVVLRDSQKHPQGSNVRRWPASESELLSLFFFFGEFTLRFLIRNLPTECTKQLKECGRMANFLDILMHRHVELVPTWHVNFRTPAVLCGPNSHNRAKHTTPKQIISVNTRNNKIYPSMTHAKSLLFNVTLLVRPGLEPKIARFGGPHGVSCSQGLNPRHGPLQVLTFLCCLYLWYTSPHHCHGKY
jgi:hypothetical protein